MMRTLATILSSVLLFGCQIQQEKPTSVQIETIGMKAMQQADASAERKLMSWSKQNMPVAQRELGLLYQRRPEQRADALRLFEQAARAGDTDAAFQLGEMLRVGTIGVVNVTPQPAAAAPWYRIAAGQKHARAALALGLLYKNGDGVTRDDAQAAHWLEGASEAGNPHAMFLLSYIYREGRGVTQDNISNTGTRDDGATGRPAQPKRRTPRQPPVKRSHRTPPQQLESLLKPGSSLTPVSALVEQRTDQPVPHA
jgi:TPR repeat protein